MTSPRDPIFGAAPEQFIWASGIEDTFVIQSKKGHRPLDEYELMGHYEHWREDLGLGRIVNLNAVRWGVPWYRVEPKKGEFDWSWTDQVLPYIVEELKITPIVDLMHYGCPKWMYREFINKDYPAAVARYAKAFAERYKTLAKYYTPLNEPVVNALYCGSRAHWPPYLEGDAGYIRIMVQLAKGIQNTIEAIKSVDSDAIMVHVEATGLSRAATEELQSIAVEDEHRGNLCLDLITGKIVSGHPLRPWMIRHGTPITELQAIADRGITLDVLGLNFYPQWSTQQLYINEKGQLAYRAHEQDGVGFGTMIHSLYDRYQCPIMVTETSAFGSHELREKWLKTSLSTIKELREGGIPVLGFTWFPLFTMIDWRYRFGKGPKEQYRVELGLFRHHGPLDEGQESLVGSTNQTPETTGELFGRWEATELITQWNHCVSNPEQTIGRMPAHVSIRL
jgi:beta-glucosidase/6-phospho-beta-glucosidase/beta-galactosidase